MTSILEKGGGTFTGIKLLLCENPLPPIEEAVAAAQAELPRSNYYTEPYSAPLRRLVSAQLGVPERLIHINAGSELILRQLFDRFGEQVHLLTPTYPLFPEVAQRWSETRLLPERDFAFDLAELAIPDGTSLVVIALNSAAGVAGYLGRVTFDWATMAGFTALAIAGVLGGAALAPRVPAARLRRGFALFLIAMAALILLQNLVPGAPGR